MMRNKAVSVTAALAVAVLALTACSAGDGTRTGAAAEKESGDSAETTFKLAFNQQPNHPQFVALDAMGDRLKERTGGKYDIEVFPNETLGTQKDTIELVKAGTIEMSMVAGPLMESLNPDFVVFDLPFTFDSQEHQRTTTNDPAIVSELYSSLDDQGLHVLGSFHGGVRNMYTSKGPITRPEDMKGLKIRVIESDTNIEMMKMMGGSPAPMGMGEVYTAIQSGVLDGAENNELTYANVKHAEVAKYYSYTRHLMLPDYLLINPKVTDEMSEEHRKIFLEEIATAIEEEGELWEQEIPKSKALAEQAGTEFNEVDADAFTALIAPLTQKKLTNDTVRDIHAKVRAAAEGLEP
ncbi:C4-dicarboxylate ABC transporter substrate-binding protein [Kineosporia sp. NBRC 101677]|uniref:TRAP transporter substrate-binding protein n=1 Tax=Kineosporia sp. NBRC 101677 TaxID=3032197 RepID=UPI0024A05377|nr:TRAP transporter substrate-binding protein [Kineosporia sp. NBRC 101677]GLY17977.1 C4-dicarboxylate ABC transporter substrate-binding protein [Kineosporia sp. NBRC 101677]